eukprot:310315_1
MSSIALSFFSVAARFTSDDRIFFVKDAERLGLKYQRRFPKKKKPQHESHKHDDADSDSEAEDDEEILNQTDLHHTPSTKGEASRSVTPSEPKEDREASLQDTNPNIQIKRYEPTFINFRYDHGSDGPDGSVITCRAQTAKLNKNKNKKDVLHWNTRTVHYAPRSNQYSIKGLEPATEYVLRLSFRAEAAEQGKWTDWTENTLFTTPYFTGWTIWNYIGFNRAYLFRYSFRMCDVFSRLMILALVWSVLSGTTTFGILVFEIITVVVYSQQIEKYNFFQFLVATYFSEDNRKQTVSYCFFRRIESLVYLIIVSWVVLFDRKYNQDALIDCVDTYADDPDDALFLCDADPSDTCDCMLQNEVYSTKLLLLLAWSFANLSGDVFFGAFNSMRDKFGTNERNIVNVMEKRDWGALSEMLAFGYRMNRFDEKSQRSGLSTFLDRVPSDKFLYKEVESMIRLGAKINDQSVRPKNEEDHDEPKKVGDNVLIRYVKVTPCKIIDAQFDDVVKKWTTIGVKGGSYPQTKDRICVRINAKNTHGYTAFKVYWEKVQYVRRQKLKEKRDIKYRRRCHQMENEYDEKDKAAHPTPRIDRDEDKLNAWFHRFYQNILKWQELGADMSTVSEDGVSALSTYVSDIKNEDIKMATITRLCPIDGKDLDEKEEKYESIEMDADHHLEKKPFFVDKPTRQSAFREWYLAHDFSKKLFDVADIQIWHDLGATDDIQNLEVLRTYFEQCDPKDQKTDDIDALIQCGCSLENTKAKQFPSKQSLSITTIIDTIFETGKVNLDIVEYLVDKYDVGVETNDNPNWQDVSNPCSYSTQLSKYIINHDALTIENIQRLIERGYLLKRKEDRGQSFVCDAVRNNKLPFDVFLYLLDRIEPPEDDVQSKHAVEGVGTLDCKIFNNWILGNEHITFEQIQTLITEYKFSPYQSKQKSNCAIHYIWKNKSIDFNVMHQFWLEYGEAKFGKFKHIYVGFLWHILRKRKMTERKDIQKLEIIFKDHIVAIDEDTGNGWLHFYCENSNLQMEILEYLCNKHNDQLLMANKNGDKPLHLLCKNSSLKIEHLQYFVVELGIPMTLANEAGFQPFQALHYLVDNNGPNWKKKDVEIMIHKLEINFETIRAGEIILYRLSKEHNWSNEALIHLYHHYKDQVDLNSLRSAKEMWKDEANSGGTTILLHLIRSLTPSQVVRLTDKDFVGLDSTAKDNENTTIMHKLGKCSPYKLQTVCQILKNEYGADFAVDMPDKSGSTPFQKWLRATGSKDMHTFQVWAELGADITQNESGTAYNTLHRYTARKPNRLRLSYFRKLCFDVENPWSAGEQSLEPYKRTHSGGRHDRVAFQVPLHTRPVPDNDTLFKIYVRSAVSNSQPVQISVLEYFASKKDEGVRAVLDTTKSPLWIYMKHKHIDLNVVKYMVESLGCSVRPAPSDVIVFQYMNNMKKRNAIDWDVLDYFYDLEDDEGNKIVDFKSKEKDLTLLHKYCHQVREESSDIWRDYQTYRQFMRGESTSLIFACDDFKQLIQRYDLKSILKDENDTNPSPAAYFYEHRANEIRPDIIQCFTDLGFDINEPVNNKTPLQHYCCSNNTYIMKSIVRSFIQDGGAKVNDRIPGQQAPSTSQVIANAISRKLLKMMVETFDVALVNAKKRTQDVWFSFMNDYSGSLPNFKELLSIYVDRNFKPTHLFHSDKDGDKRIQYKLYRVSVDGIDMEEEEEKNADLKLKKNKKKLKIAKKYIGRIVYVTDARDSLFRSSRVIDARSSEDAQARDIPQKWLRPVHFKEMIEEIDELEAIYKSFRQQMPGLKLAEQLVIIDIDSIRSIQALITQCAITDDKGKLKTMNDIILEEGNTILTKYIATNHRTDILSSDIDEMKQYGIDFEHKNSAGLNALHLYCILSKGILDENVVKSLIDGGCPINWPYEKVKNKDEDSDNDDDEEDDTKEDKGLLERLIPLIPVISQDTKREYVPEAVTPLHLYCQLEESDLVGFQILRDCGADVHLESREKFNAIYYLLRESHHINKAFIAYLVKKCKVNFHRQLSSGWSLFNFFLNENPQINTETVTALCNIAKCDANSRDDENDTNSIKSYVQNNKRKFDFAIIKCLVDLGAEINEPDDQDTYPIQHVLKIRYSPLATLMKYARNMIECGAKLQHILADDPLSIEDNKLYILQQMKDGYEMYDGSWCRIESWSWGRKKKQTVASLVQSAVALDRFGATKLFIRIERQNLIEITQKMLIDEYQEFASVSANHAEDEEDEPKEQEQEKVKHHDVVEEEPKYEVQA